MQDWIINFEATCAYCGAKIHAGDTAWIDDDGEYFCSKSCLKECQYYFHPVFCQSCSGTGVYLGILGNRVNFRCEDCGIEFSQPI